MDAPRPLTARRPEGWGGPDPSAARRRALLLGVALGAVPGLVVAASLALGFGGVAAAVGGAVYALALWGWVGGQGRRALRAVGAQEVDATRSPRFANLVAGLAAELGIEPPSLWTIPSGGPNALVCRVGGRGCVAATRTLLASYSRTEVEAVVAHCLLRLRDASLLPEAVVTAAGGRVPGAPPLVGAAIDVVAASLTRYPSALASAIAKATPPDRCRPYWFFADPPSHEPRERRIALLEDL